MFGSGKTRLLLLYVEIKNLHSPFRPLLPSTCQSVRMDFLALAPGVHSIDTLTLTDIQTGFAVPSVSLLPATGRCVFANFSRSLVIDIIVHEFDSLAEVSV